MQKLRTFNHVFWKSISSFSYYREIIKAKFVFSWKYFLFFSIFLGTLLTISLSMVLIPTINTFLGRFSSRITSLYPMDLVITIKNGELSTNVTEPLRFPIPVELFTDVPGAISDQNQKYLLTIDTQGKIDDYKNSQSIIFATKDSVVIAEGDAYRVYPIKDMNDITINKNLIDTILAKLTPVLKYLPIIIPLVLFMIFSIILPISRLMSLVILTFVLLVIANLMKLNLTYSKIYQIGLHSLTLPTLIQIIMTAFGLIPPIPFFNSILFILYTLIIFAEFRKSPINS